jgi:hypothetical protein
VVSTAVSGVRRVPLFLAATAVVVLAAMLFATGRARAAELLYWDNYSAEPNTIGFASIDGSGAGLLNLSGLRFETSEGTAYDPVANRLYVAAEGIAPVKNEGEIVYVNLDGSGAGVFSAPAPPPKNPEGIAIDPATRMIYWLNTGDDTVSWANLDGIAGGLLNIMGAEGENFYRLGLDPVGGRVYWSANKGAERLIDFANVNNTGGGVLPVTLPTTTAIRGFAADPTSGRLYYLNAATGNPSIDFTGLTGGAVSQIPLGSAYNTGYGLSVDPILNKAYWGNYGNEEVTTNAIGFTSLAGATGGITPSGTPVNGPQDPVIVKSPSGAGAPQLTQSKAQLSCSQGTWGPDYPGSYVYQSPRTYAYQWTLNGAPVAGATASTFTATSPGTYGCTVIAANQAGSASQSSTTAATVTKAKFKLTAKKKLKKAKPGKLASFKVQTVNQGDLGTKAAKLCVKVPKKAKKALQSRKCKSLKAIAAGGSVTTRLKVKVKPTATPKAYKLKITLPGTKVLKVTLKVLG